MLCGAKSIKSSESEICKEEIAELIVTFTTCLHQDIDYEGPEIDFSAAEWILRGSLDHLTSHSIYSVVIPVPPEEFSYSSPD
jgi:hypothetical protein